MLSRPPHRLLLVHRTLAALALTTALGACAPPGKPPEAEPLRQEPVPDAADPMAGFARLVGGEWRVKFTSGESGVQAWRWGPGNHSILKLAQATEDAVTPWVGEVLYWHPGRKQVSLLSLHGDIPGVGRGVGEGTVTSEGDSIRGVLNLQQPRGLRKLAFRWYFDGPDKYHDTLLEDSGTGFRPLAEWDFVRSGPGAETKSRQMETAPPPSKLGRAFDAILGRTWEAAGGTADGRSFHIESTYQWVSSLDVVFARITSLNSDRAPLPLLDVYVYVPLGADEARCLALSGTGAVYEGTLAVLDAGALQLELQGYEGDRAGPYVVRLDPDPDGTLRQRVWCVAAADRTLVLDVRHRQRDGRK